jgi:hypothetical protein
MTYVNPTEMRRLPKKFTGMVKASLYFTECRSINVESLSFRKDFSFSVVFHYLPAKLSIINSHEVT